MSDLLDAWTSLLLAADNIGNNTGYLHDLVDVTRQVLQFNGDIYYKKMLNAYFNKEIDSFQ